MKSPKKLCAPGVFISVLLLSFSTIVLASQDTLIPIGATWKYHEKDALQPPDWTGVAFDDSKWPSRSSQLVLDDPDDESGTSISPSSRITLHYRNSFQIQNVADVKTLTLQMLRDSFAIVYLNSTEIYRSSKLTGNTSSATSSSSQLAVKDQFIYSIDPALLRTGRNTVAVEIQRADPTSSDTAFDLSLVAATTVTVTRGPYLQIGTPTSLIVRWRTSAASDARVRYGLDPAALTSFVDNVTSTAEHVVQISGLAPNTRYYYSIGTTVDVLAGGTSDYTFLTSPVAGVAKKTRVWVIGDAGTANSNQAAVRDAYLNYTGTTNTDLWLMLGDNAYNSGLDSEYQTAVFNMYAATLRKSVLWATLGNHDGTSADSASQSGPYYDNFSLPKNGEAGGLASGTEAYYSFDYGNIHFICLESFETDRSANGTMMTWLKNDLAANTREWTVAFWHHPPYSKGSHDSDTDTAMTQMRQNALPILENAGVDLVLTGHSHSYERSFLIDGHYGLSSTFTSSMKKDGGSGREDGTGAYEKTTDGPAAHEGAVYAVAGSSGQTSGGTLNHPAMYLSLNVLGSVVLDVNGPRMDVKFLDNVGAVRDYFTILKGQTAGILNPPSSLKANALSSTNIGLAWTDNSTGESGFKIEKSLDGSLYTQVATVGPNVVTYTHGSRLPSTLYYYRVRAYDAVSDSAYSNIATVTTPPLPAAPSSLTARATTQKKIALSWIDNSADESGFRIERSTDGITFSQIASVAANVKTYTNSGLTRKKLYYYRVRAYRTTNGFTDNSGYSNSASAISK